MVANCKSSAVTSLLGWLSVTTVMLRSGVVGAVYIATSSLTRELYLWGTLNAYPRIFSRRREQRRQSSSVSFSHKNLLSLDECLALSNQKKARFVDGSWYHKGQRNGRKEFEEGPRIAGSIHFDMDDIKSNSTLSHMLPSVGLLNAWMKHYEIQYGREQIVVYAREGCYFAPRVWFTFSQLGHAPVSVMQASLEEWIEHGGPIDTEPVSVARTSDFRPASTDNEIVPEEEAANTIDLKRMEQILASLSADGSDSTTETDAVILDARGSSFANGHMPGALNVPYSTLNEAGSTTRLKSKDELVTLFREAGFDPQLDAGRTVVCTCGSGVSACSLYLALRECGCRDEIVMYDGSWQEWGSINALPKTVPNSQ